MARVENTVADVYYRIDSMKYWRYWSVGRPLSVWVAGEHSQIAKEEKFEERENSRLFVDSKAGGPGPEELVRTQNCAWFKIYA